MQTSDYVRTDEHGVMRVGNNRVMLDSVLAGFAQGQSPESIRSQYPALTLEEVYGAITYYLSNQQEIDAYLRRQDAVWAQAKAEAGARPAPVIERLRAKPTRSTG